METEKLYELDSGCREFTATVTGCTQAEGGWEIPLDRTAFYPEGGGQSYDTGTLEETNVTAVWDREGAVIHLCDSPLEVGAVVTGTLNWQRRLDLMQQHSGEHIVSGILHKLFGAHNVGFHMGADVITVDFDVVIPPQALAQVEEMANQAVYQDLPVRCWYPTQAQLKKVAYRSKKQLPWPVRIVEVPGYDTCACCGTHVMRTGQIGLIKLLSCVKFHQGVRIEMLCGGRALELLTRVYEQNRLVSQVFSAKLLETGAAAQRMNEQLAAEKFRSAGLEKKMFDMVAQGFAGKGDVLYFAEEIAPGALRELADRIAQQCGGTAAVFSGKDQSYNLCLVNKTADISDLGRELNRVLNGRGGGKTGIHQGSVSANKKQIEAFFYK